MMVTPRYRKLAYCRGPEADCQQQEAQIHASGFEGATVTQEDVPGACATAQRPKLGALLKGLEFGDTLIVTRLDGLGQDTADALQTIELVKAKGADVVCLSVGTIPITSERAGLALAALGAVVDARFNVAVEQSSVVRARTKAQGSRMGRPPALPPELAAELQARKAAGETVSALAREFNVSRSTIERTIERGNGPGASPQR